MSSQPSPPANAESSNAATATSKATATDGQGSVLLLFPPPLPPTTTITTMVSVLPPPLPRSTGSSASQESPLTTASRTAATKAAWTSTTTSSSSASSASSIVGTPSPASPAAASATTLLPSPRPLPAAAPARTGTTTSLFSTTDAASTVIIGDGGVVGGKKNASIWKTSALLNFLKMRCIEEPTLSSLRCSLDLRQADLGVKLVVVCFSANVCIRGTILEDEWKSLIRKLKKRFPKARILMGSVLFPLYGGRLKFRVLRSNDCLKTIVQCLKFEGIHYVDLRNVTRKRSEKRLRLKEHLFDNALFPNAECVRRISAALFKRYEPRTD